MTGNHGQAMRQEIHPVPGGYFSDLLVISVINVGPSGRRDRGNRREETLQRYHSRNWKRKSFVTAGKTWPALSLFSFNYSAGHLLLSPLHSQGQPKDASVRLGPKTLRTLDEEVKSLVSAWRSSSLWI